MPVSESESPSMPASPKDFARRRRSPWGRRWMRRPKGRSSSKGSSRSSSSSSRRHQARVGPLARDVTITSSRDHRLLRARSFFITSQAVVVERDHQRAGKVVKTIIRRGGGASGASRPSACTGSSSWAQEGGNLAHCETEIWDRSFAFPTSPTGAFLAKTKRPSMKSGLPKREALAANTAMSRVLSWAPSFAKVSIEVEVPL